MVDRLLVPTDGSDPATAALEHAATIAATTKATGHVLHVAENTDEDDPVAEQIVDEGMAWFEDAGATVIGEIRSDSPTGEIADYASEIDADVIVIGTHGRHGIQRLVLGSVTEAVVRDGEVPVLVVSPDGELDVRYPYQTIVVGVDGSEHSLAAVKRAVSFASPHATIHVLSVIDVTPVVADERIKAQFETAAKTIVNDAEAAARAAGANDVETEVLIGPPAREIRSKAADVGADLIAVGTHGRRGVDRLLLGSVAERVLRTAPTPVLTVRSADR
ncbi:universal stress protein [Natrinema sp. H-ect4]|uniref:universal stress protein n=1 Tax=Natrinema sp. H-ect4 TaxID=3242699 RepID=UPI0035A88F73